MPYGSANFRNNNSPWSRSSQSSYASGSGHPVGNKRAHSPEGSSYGFKCDPVNSKSKTLSGRVTKLFSSWGLIDDNIHFPFKACIKEIPKISDFVSVAVVPFSGSQYRWTAITVQINNGRNHSYGRTTSNHRSENDRKRFRVVNRSRGSSREQRYDEIARKRPKRDDKTNTFRESDKDVRRERDRPKEHESSSVRRSKTPIKLKVCRYGVQVPHHQLVLTDADVITVKKRYPAMYIPSEFIWSSFTWMKSLPLTEPYTLNKPCSFHIMPRDCDPCIPNEAIHDPPDVDYSFSAKVMLVSLPRLDEIYKKTIRTAEELQLHKEDERTCSHLSRVIHFMIGSCGKNEPLAIGGAWSPSLDGENPSQDQMVLIRTAIRTCNALTGIDLSSCSQWYRFMEVYYHRSERVYKEKTIAARIETVVFFVPEVWNCVPTIPQWDSIVADYNNLCEQKLHPKNSAHQDTSITKQQSSSASSSSLPINDQIEESDKEEDLVVIDKCEEKEPIHFSELDPKNMKVADLRQELEARSLSTKGLKQHLVQRLTLALRKERDREEEEEAGIETKISLDEMEESVNDDEDEIIKAEGELKVVDELKVMDDTAESEDTIKNDSNKRKEQMKQLQKEQQIVDETSLRKKYTLPKSPHIIVHPSKTAKNGKFDCSLTSLSTLLDYRPTDNKENAFELFLFAEIFYEMLQRDFAFYIYKTLCELPQPQPQPQPQRSKENKEGISPAEENVECEKSLKKDSSEDEKKSNEEDKIGTEEERTSISKKESSVDDTDNSKNSLTDNVENGTRRKREDSKKRDTTKMVTQDAYLLLSFSFFDKTHCGYIYDRDLEAIFHCLGLRLSRHQVKKLISKVSSRETVYYRKMTDQPDDGLTLNPLTRPESTIDCSHIALGNTKYTCIFSQDNVRGSSSDSSKMAAAGRLIEMDGGTVVDVKQTIVTLKKSEMARLEIEKQLVKYRKENDTLRDSLSRSNEKEKKVSQDLKICRDRLAVVTKETASLTIKSKTYYRMLTNIKEMISDVEENAEKIGASTKTAKLDEKDKAKELAKNCATDEKFDVDATNSTTKQMDITCENVDERRRRWRRRRQISTASDGSNENSEPTFGEC